MAKGRIKLGVDLELNKSNINTIRTELNKISKMTGTDLMKINPELNLGDAVAQLTKVKDTAHGVEKALDKAFNSSIGTIDLTRFNSELQKSGLTVQKIQKDFLSVGATGTNAFRNLSTQLLTTNMKLKESHSLLDSMAETMGNTIKWGIASSAMNSFTGGIAKAYSYVVGLDSALTDILIVTEKSREEMERFAVAANKSAQNLGTSTRDFTEAALIYYQQGDDDAIAQAKAEITLKTANVTGQSADTVSEQLTAVWNGYKVDAAEAELYIDKLAAVAATTASDLEELSTGMSKVASAANIMGVDIDQLNAQLATIVSVTRQAPESVGTALKTIYARMGDIEAGLDTETTLGLYALVPINCFKYHAACVLISTNATCSPFSVISRFV